MWFDKEDERAVFLDRRRERHAMNRPKRGTVEWTETDPDILADFTALDPFAGSGTVGVAAKRTGRAFIGAEISPRHHEDATMRIHSANDQAQGRELDATSQPPSQRRHGRCTMTGQLAAIVATGFNPSSAMTGAVAQLP